MIHLFWLSNNVAFDIQLQVAYIPTPYNYMFRNSLPVCILHLTYQNSLKKFYIKPELLCDLCEFPYKDALNQSKNKGNSSWQLKITLQRKRTFMYRLLEKDANF